MNHPHHDIAYLAELKKFLRIGFVACTCEGESLVNLVEDLVELGCIHAQWLAETVPFCQINGRNNRYLVERFEGFAFGPLDPQLVIILRFQDPEQTTFSVDSCRRDPNRYRHARSVYLPQEGEDYSITLANLFFYRGFLWELVEEEDALLPFICVPSDR